MTKLLRFIKHEMLNVKSFSYFVDNYKNGRCYKQVLLSVGLHGTAKRISIQFAGQYRFQRTLYHLIQSWQ